MGYSGLAFFIALFVAAFIVGARLQKIYKERG
ncbi:unnamed protein product, partial [marine sediment metagenome]